MLLQELAPATPEQKIKISVIEYMRLKGFIASEDTVLSEFAVDGHSRRADLVLIRKNDLVAIEIKSETDTLSRLKGQTEKYLEFFDKVIVVSAGRHLKNVEKQIPEEVALWEYSTNSIKVIQRGRKKNIKNKVNILKLIRSRELSVIATKFGYKGTNRDRRSLEFFLLDQPVSRLRAELILSMKKRYYLTAQHFWSSVEGVPVTASSIERLSFSGANKGVQKKEEELSVFLSKLSHITRGLSRRPSDY
ncbi:sce7726 family protein [Nitrincola sp. A-D6]|uniref:sce7726 family protein n=1 Tax=Nitrincola sp. A-D6 TaxID=1545442 RepID=UPI001F25E283|nr:sce7726 family protein [Nitrincola sp. A-D6]